MDYLHQLISLINSINSPLKKKFVNRIRQKDVSRQENSSSHFCVFFAPIDIKNEKIFFGLHKKSGLWLFNGGHIEKEELPQDTVKREMLEEWGYIPEDISNLIPEFLSYTKIENPHKACKEHYDIWFFIKTKQVNFHPNQTLLNQEFLETKWLNIPAAESLCVGQYSSQALEYIEQKYFKQTKKNNRIAPPS